MKHVHATLTVNGEDHAVSFPTHHTLLEVLRERLGLTGTKHGCELGECGACAVLVDGKPLLSCLTLALECEGRAIATIEGAAEGADLSPLQEAFADLGGAQCGYCTPAMILTAQALVEDDAEPTREAIAEALAGNLCRCTGYLQVVDAVQHACELLRERASSPRAAGGSAS